jgi:hypothetical protein
MILNEFKDCWSHFLQGKAANADFGLESEIGIDIGVGGVNERFPIGQGVEERPTGAKAEAARGRQP